MKKYLLVLLGICLALTTFSQPLLLDLANFEPNKADTLDPAPDVIDQIILQSANPFPDVHKGS